MAIPRRGSFVSTLVRHYEDGEASNWRHPGYGIVLFITARVGQNGRGRAYSIVKYVSMSVVLTAGTVDVALKTDTHLERLKAAYRLIQPYMVIEVAALGL